MISAKKTTLTVGWLGWRVYGLGVMAFALISAAWVAADSLARPRR